MPYLVILGIGALLGWIEGTRECGEGQTNSIFYEIFKNFFSNHNNKKPNLVFIFMGLLLTGFIIKRI